MADQDPIDPILNSQEVKEFAKNVESLKDSLFGAIDNAKDITEAFRDSSQSTRDTYMNVNKTRDALEDITDLYSRLGTQYISEERINTRIVKNDMMRETILERIVKTSNSIGESQEYINGIIEHIKSNSFDITTADDNILKLLVQQLDTVDGLSVSYNHILSKLDEENDKYAETYMKTSAIKKVLSSIANIPVIGPLLEFENIGKKLQSSIREGYDEIIKQSKKLMESPLVKMLLSAVIISKLVEVSKAYVDVLFEVDKGITKISNDLGMSKQAGDALYATFASTSADTIFGGEGLIAGLDKAFYSVRNMAAASGELSESLGTNAMFTDKMIQGQILMTKQMNMTSEEAAGIQRLSLLTGKSADGILQTSIKQNNAAISYRKILKEVSSISAELSMRYANDPEAIAKAVVQANKLGMSLEETRKISNSLLNFETSIEGELESELLLGKQFNFEKARELALMGKSSEAAGELLKQIGGINALEKMNVIQRDRVANAIGLSADELSKAAINQEVLNKLGLENQDALKERMRILQQNNDLAGIAALQAEAAKVQGGEVLLQDIAKANMAQKYEETMNKLKDILGVLISHSTALKVVFMGIALVATAIATSMMMAAMESMILSGGITAILGGAAIGATALSGIGAAVAPFAVTAVADSVTAPGGQTVSMPKGSLLPDKNDYVYTSTNPLPTGNGGGDNLVASKIDELIGHVKKGGNVYIDSTRSGTAYGMSYNSYA